MNGKLRIQEELYCMEYKMHRGGATLPRGGDIGPTGVMTLFFPTTAVIGGFFTVYLFCNSLPGPLVLAPLLHPRPPPHAPSLVEGGPLVGEGTRAVGKRGRAHCLLPALPDLPEETLKVSTELDPDKDIEHRIEAAVGESQVSTDEHGNIQLLADLAFLDDLEF
jgi:hypothetical protein